MFSGFEVDQIHDSCSLAGTDLLSLPPVCKDLEDSNHVEIPMSASGLSSACNQPVEFYYKGTPNVYLDLKNSYIYMTCVLEHKDGTRLEPKEEVGPINLLTAALFEHAEIYVNETLVSAAGSNYSMRSYLEALLYYNKNAKEGPMTSEMYYEDSPGAFNSISSEDVPYNQGMDLRKSITAGSNEFDLYFTPRLELFNQEKILLPCDLRLRLMRQNSQFYIMAKDITKNYQIRFLSASLFLRVLKLAHPFALQLKNDMEENKIAKYPMLRSDVTSFLIPFGTTSVSYPVSQLGKQPIRMYLAFVNNVTLNGDYTKNPYNFEHHLLTNISFQINGKTLPTVPIKISYQENKKGEVTGGLYLRAFNELQRTTGALGLNDGYGIDRSKYIKGFFIIGQKTTEAFSDVHFAPTQQGTLIINLQFKKPVPALSCILFFEYQNVLTINGSGVVKLDYSV